MNASISNDSSKIQQLARLLEETDLNSASAADEAVSLAASIQDEEDKDLALLRVAKALALAGQWTKAEEAAQAINSDLEKSEAFCEIAVQLSSVELPRTLALLSEAEHAADKVVEPWQRAELLTGIAQVLMRVERYDQAKEVLDRAIAVARNGEQTNDPQGSVDCSSVLKEIAEKLAQAGLVDRATEVARAIKSPGKRDGALSFVQNASKG